MTRKTQERQVANRNTAREVFPKDTGKTALRPFLFGFVWLHEGAYLQRSITEQNTPYFAVVFRQKSTKCVTKLFYYNTYFYFMQQEKRRRKIRRVFYNVIATLCCSRIFLVFISPIVKLKCGKRSRNSVSANAIPPFGGERKSKKWER